MRIRRAHFALAAVLAGAALTLTGCSDSPAASGPTANGTQPTKPSQTQTQPQAQGTQTTKSVEGSTDDENPPPADDNGWRERLLLRAQGSGDTFAKWQEAGPDGAKEQETIAKSFDRSGRQGAR